MFNSLSSGPARLPAFKHDAGIYTITRRGRAIVPRASQGLGQQLSPESLQPGRQLGSGSFGECYRVG